MMVNDRMIRRQFEYGVQPSNSSFSIAPQYCFETQRPAQPQVVNHAVYPKRLSQDVSYDWQLKSGPKSVHSEMDEFFGDTDSEGSDRMLQSSNASRSEEGFSYQRPTASIASNQQQQQQFKCRQLPCKTFISTGSCPYGDRCVFLHDPSIVSKPVYVKTKRKSADDNSTDAFFWPTMSFESVMGKVDFNKNMPHISQPYVVPAPNNSYAGNSNNDRAVFSMWEHFLDFCKADAHSIVGVPRHVPSLNPAAPMNPYTGKKRLPVLVALSHSVSLY